MFYRFDTTNSPVTEVSSFLQSGSPAISSLFLIDRACLVIIICHFGWIDCSIGSLQCCEIFFKSSNSFGYFTICLTTVTQSAFCFTNIIESLEVVNTLPHTSLRSSCIVTDVGSECSLIRSIGSNLSSNSICCGFECSLLFVEVINLLAPALNQRCRVSLQRLDLDCVPVGLSCYIVMKTDGEFSILHLHAFYFVSLWFT